MSQPSIEIVVTGGTIDSEWDPARDTAVVGKESVLPKYFERLDLDVAVSFNVVCMKDSRELTPDDLKEIYEAVENSPANKIMITHGTYTMPDTARFIEAHLKSKKAVVLTGAMVPLVGFSMSDASFNLGFSIATLLNMDSGVRLCMHGRLFKPQEVAKNMSDAHFFSIEQ